MLSMLGNDLNANHTKPENDTEFAKKVSNQLDEA